MRIFHSCVSLPEGKCLCLHVVPIPREVFNVLNDEIWLPNQRNASRARSIKVFWVIQQVLRAGLSGMFSRMRPDLGFRMEIYN